MKDVLKKYAKRYFIDAMGAMALGLFASLLIGTIFNALGMIPGLSILSTIGKGAQGVAGPAMAVAIAVSLKASPLVVYSCAAVGALAAEGHGAPDIASALGMAPFKVGLCVTGAKRYGKEALASIVSEIARVDAESKFGGLSGYTAVELFIAKYV